MSKKGVKQVANIFSQMQELRIELLSSKSKQDIKLAQLLESMKDAGKQRFSEITLEDDIDDFLK
jgi:hypothetical protein